MKNDVKISNKLKFEKPKIHEAEFLSCLVPMVSTTYPHVALAAVTCQAPIIAIEAPFCLVC